MRRIRGVAIIGTAVILAACAADGGGASAAGGDASGGAGGTTVDVTLQEWAVVLSEASVPAGDVTFAITNEGPEDVHEFVILRTDLDLAALPTDDTGAVDVRVRFWKQSEGPDSARTVSYTIYVV